MVSMTDARSQQVGKWAIICGALVLAGAVVFAIRSGSDRNGESAAGRARSADLLSAQLPGEAAASR